MVNGRVDFERVERLGRFAAVVAAKGDPGIEVEVSDVRFQDVQTRKLLAARVARQS